MIRKSLLALAFLFGIGSSASAQTASEEFREMLEKQMILFCTKIADPGDGLVCKIEHRLIMVKARTAEALAVHADVFRKLGNHDKADELREQVLALLREIKDDLDRLRVLYRK